VFPRLYNLRRPLLFALVGLMIVSCRPASALDVAGRCFHDKMRASRVGVSAWFGCRRFGIGDEAKLDRCSARTETRVDRLLATADSRARKASFECPADRHALAISRTSNWPSRLIDAGSIPGPGLPPCGDQQMRAARRFASAYASCVEDAGAGQDPHAIELCARRPREAFLAAWKRGEACADADGQAAMADIEAEIDETASRLLVRCGDGHVAGFEECDDGAAVANDGCSADCRIEDCSRVGDEVRCKACAGNSIPNEEYEGCRCPGGFEGEAGSCIDIDECAAGGAACPEGRPCVNLEGTWACAIPCTAEAFHEALATCGAPSGAIAFDCNDAVIAIAGDGDLRARDVACNDLTIDGAGRNVTFELAPVCWQTPLLPEQCPDGLAEDGTCRCPNVDSGAQFLLLRGDRNVVRDLTVRGFFDGIPVRGRGNVVENVRFDRMCDDAFGSVVSGVGNVFRHLSVRSGCDKCSENGGPLGDTDPDPRVTEHYNGVLSDIDFDSCRTPVRIASSGRFLMDNLKMHANDPGFPCDGPRFSSSGADESVVVHLRASLLEGCRRGIRFGSGADGELTGNRIRVGALRGLRVAGSSRVSVERTTFDSNGGTGSSEAGFGGIAVLGGGSVDLGGGQLSIDGELRSSGGANFLCDNRGPDGLPRDLDNSGVAAVAAAGNWWCTPGSGASRVVGLADLDPQLSRAPLRRARVE